MGRFHANRTAEATNPSPIERNVRQLLIERYRCFPEDLAEFTIKGNLSPESGYFKFGCDTICYGQCSFGVPALAATDALYDAAEHIRIEGASVDLPFDPEQIIDNLRCERYCAGFRGINGSSATNTASANSRFRSLYYLVRPILGASVRKHLQKLYFRGWEKIPFPKWPVDHTVETLFEQLLATSMKARKIEKIPFIWFWPEAARSCTIMTHDVESSAGLDFCPQLMDLNDSYGIKSSFQIVPEKRYPVTPSIIKSIQARGFEVNVHDLNHDGQLMAERQEFLRRVELINSYGRNFDAAGFRSAIMYRNLDWFDALDFTYDMSVPNTAHLDPQRGGCCTVMPYSIGKILELPLTTTQDYSMFSVLNDYSVQLWEAQIALIRENYGLISFIVHPDYIIEPAARAVYEQLLQLLCGLRERGETWIALPREVADWWKLRNGLKLVKNGDGWLIAGNGCERARLAFATLKHDQIAYEFAQ